MAQGLSTALLAVLALPAVRAGDSTGFASNHSLNISITEDSGLNWSVPLSGILAYDQSTGALALPAWGTAVGAGWEWVKESVVDSTSGAVVVRDALKWHTAERVGDETTPWRSTVSVYAAGNVDPFLTYAFSAKNNTGTTQSYVFTYGEAIVPTVSGNYDVSASLAGSVTNGNDGSTAKLTPNGVDLDGDGVLETQVLKLSNDGGLTFFASGVDVGAAVETTTASGPTLYGVYADSTTGVAPAGINYWEIETRFTLTPNKDAVALSGYVELTEQTVIPEPSTYAIVIGAGGLGAVLLRRRKQS